MRTEIIILAWAGNQVMAISAVILRLICRVLGHYPRCEAWEDGGTTVDLVRCRRCGVVIGIRLRDNEV